MASGGHARNQVAGSTDANADEVKEARVTPAVLAATVFCYRGIDLDAKWTDLQGRTQPSVTDGDRPIPELG